MSCFSFVDTSRIETPQMDIDSVSTWFGVPIGAEIVEVNLFRLRLGIATIFGV